MDFPHLYIPTINGIPEKAFTDAKAAVRWMHESADDPNGICCPDLQQMRMSVPNAVLALQDGYHLTSRIWAVYRVKVH